MLLKVALMEAKLFNLVCTTRFFSEIHP